MENGPACPVRGPPPMMSLERPILRLKKTSVSRLFPNWNSSERSRKKSLFSG